MGGRHVNPNRVEMATGMYHQRVRAHIMKAQGTARGGSQKGSTGHYAVRRQSRSMLNAESGCSSLPARPVPPPTPDDRPRCAPWNPQRHARLALISTDWGSARVSDVQRLSGKLSVRDQQLVDQPFRADQPSAGNNGQGRQASARISSAGAKAFCLP